MHASANAERVARCYARRKQGKVVRPVEIDEIEVTDFLIASRFLQVTAIDDKQAVSKALAELIDKIVKEKI